MDNKDDVHDSGSSDESASDKMPPSDKSASGNRGGASSILPPNYSAEDLKVESPAYRAKDRAPASRTGKRRSKREAKSNAAMRPLSYVPAGDISFSRTLPRSENPRHMPALTYYDRHVAKRDIALALVLALLAFASVALTYRGIGHSWDEALYLEPATKAADWWSGLVLGDTSLAGEESIAKYWGERLDSLDPLHPEISSVPKTVIGLGLKYLQAFTPTPMMAMRLPVALAFALTISLIYLIGVRTYGRWGGLGTVAAYWLMPRVFGHAHIAASETLLAFSVVLLIWAFLEGLQRWPVAILVALAFALAIDTKITALMLPFPLLLWGHLYYRRAYANNMFAMLFISPLLALAMWPWLWHDTVQRFLDYLGFYVHHQSTAVFYMRSIWGYTYGPPAPWHYPFVITGIGVPAWVLVLAAIGMLRAICQIAHKPVPVLSILVGGLFVGLVALPGSPKYDGERLFFAMFPFLALLAGGGLTAIAYFFPSVHHEEPVWRSVRGWVSATLLVVCCAWGAMDLVSWHPDELNYFNRIIGGSKGAYDAGFETSYWGEGLNEDVCAFLNDTVKPGSTVKPLALNDLAFKNLQEWGILNSGVNYSPDAPPYDYYVLQVRQGFFGRVERTLHGSGNALKTFGHGGVPIIQIFRGDAFATAPLAARAAVAVTEMLNAKRTAATTTAPVSTESGLSTGTRTTTTTAVTSTTQAIATSGATTAPEAIAMETGVPAAAVAAAESTTSATGAVGAQVTMKGVITTSTTPTSGTVAAADTTTAGATTP